MRVCIKHLSARAYAGTRNVERDVNEPEISGGESRCEASDTDSFHGVTNKQRVREEDERAEEASTNTSEERDPTIIDERNGEGRWEEGPRDAQSSTEAREEESR